MADEPATKPSQNDPPGNEPREKAPEAGNPDAEPKDTQPKKDAKPAKAPENKRPPVTPGELVGIAARAAAAAPCDNCKGSGRALEERKGNKKAIPGVTTPTITKVEGPCTKCNKNGLSTGPRLPNELKDFARQLLRVDDNSEKWPAASEKVIDRLRELTKFGSAAWTALNNNRIQTLIQQNKDPVGESVFFVGDVTFDRVEEAPEGGMAKRSLTIDVSNIKAAETIFEQPLIYDAAVEERVLCGGVIKRRAVQNGGFVLVIERGYVVRFSGNDEKQRKK
ncbi:MAG: hypothetical protein K2Y21_06680 [Phycisphaerales bacterium]|nr:hypothetical protein [Phycisphaerales bacterium]